MNVIVLITPADSRNSIVRRFFSILTLVIGIGLLIHGVGRLTNTITWRLPAIVYFAIALILLAQAAYQFRRSDGPSERTN